jgi:hypothetical protein
MLSRMSVAKHFFRPMRDIAERGVPGTQRHSLQLAGCRRISRNRALHSYGADEIALTKARTRVSQHASTSWTTTPID